MMRVEGRSCGRDDCANRVLSQKREAFSVFNPCCALLTLRFHIGFRPDCGSRGCAPQEPLALTDANLARVIDPLMARWIDESKGPGAVVVVVKRDATVFAKGYGFSDIEAKTPFTADATLVRPGSISKLFTGIAVMQLVDAGRLDLDRDVNGYIDFTIPVPEGGVPVTLRRLLKHRAGFEEHVKGLFSNSREPAPLGPWLARNLPRRLFPKGDVEAYSNYGVALAGYVVERVSGEPFAAYVQQHILDPLGMRHSTFRQPLPGDLAPLMAKAYRAADKPPLTSFETIIMAPAGALSATGTDMGRFLRALMNGGELDGARILSKARLDEMMMAPSDATPVGYLGLAFFGGKVAGHDSIGHPGATMAFFSDLQFFPGQDVGVFVSRDGIGAINPLTDTLPNPTNVIARRFLSKPPDGGGAPAVALPDNANIAGIYHLSRRAESTWLRLSDLLSERDVKVDGAGNLTAFPAIWPFIAGTRFKRVEQNLYEGLANAHFVFVEAGAEPYFVEPRARLQLQRVPWFLDVQWIMPALLASIVVVLLTLICWPIAALWRHWRGKPWSEDKGDRRKFLAVRLVLLADAAVVVAIAVFFSMPATVYNEALDPLMLVFYALAWLGVLGAIPAVWSAVQFWRSGIGGRWSRIHHSLIAASSAMVAWFFFVFRVAGTTLNY
jgi:CubicO group peptidase (beta-lactamase class C family)